MTEPLQIEFPEAAPAYEPGYDLLGTILWQTPKPVDKLELHLFWYTLGKGDQDSRIVETLRWENLSPQGERHFEIRLPRAPYSLRSENLEIRWALEATGRPGKTSARREITVAPGRTVLELPTVPDEPSSWMWKFKSWFS